LQLSNCRLHRLTEDFIISNFDCGNPDLNDFLLNDSLNYSKELMGVTYLFTKKDDIKDIVGFFTVSNDSLRLNDVPNNSKNKVNRKVSNQKRRIYYPAVKIGRLGINNGYQKFGLGKEMMDFVKGLFITNNRTGCRFILVDAYNEAKVLNYYAKNDFKYLLSEEEEGNIFKQGAKPLTRIMYFDLINKVNSNHS